jgi:hypothetical protein
VRRWEWLRRMPNRGALPQTSQTDAIAHSGVEGTRDDTR